MKKLQKFVAIDTWNWQRRKLKEQFGQLTLSDVTVTLGNENEMLARISIRLGKTRDEVIRIIRQLELRYATH